MRRVAKTKTGDPGIKRVIIYKCNDGVYLFLCASLEDGSSIGDQWYATIADAEEVCVQKYGIEANDWQLIDDPMEGCQHDWIAPVRVKGRAEGKPQWGHLERLENGEWVGVELEGGTGSKDGP
jgi:biofilm protein TabA